MQSVVPGISPQVAMKSTDDMPRRLKRPVARVFMAPCAGQPLRVAHEFLVKPTRQSLYAHPKETPEHLLFIGKNSRLNCPCFRGRVRSSSCGPATLGSPAGGQPLHLTGPEPPNVHLPTRARLTVRRLPGASSTIVKRRTPRQAVLLPPRSGRAWSCPPDVSACPSGQGLSPAWATIVVVQPLTSRWRKCFSSD